MKLIRLNEEISVVTEFGEEIGRINFSPAGGRDKRIQIDLLAVREPFRKRGIAREMMRRVKRCAASEGYRELYVIPTPCEYYKGDTGVNKETLIQIYEALGFSRIPYDDGLYHDVDMTLEIGA